MKFTLMCNALGPVNTNLFTPKESGFAANKAEGHCVVNLHQSVMTPLDGNIATALRVSAENALARRLNNFYFRLLFKHSLQGLLLFKIELI